MNNKPTLSKEAEKLFDFAFGASQLYLLPCGTKQVTGHASDGTLYRGMEINPQDIRDVLSKIEQSAILAERERVLKAVYQEIDNNTLISEMYGWRGILEQSIENVREALTQTTHKPPQGTPGRQFIENAEKFVEGSSK